MRRAKRKPTGSCDNETQNAKAPTPTGERTPGREPDARPLEDHQRKVAKRWIEDEEEGKGLRERGKRGKREIARVQGTWE